jgi:hypothetical protein
MLAFVAISLAGCAGEPDPDFMTPQLKDLKMGVGPEKIKKRIEGAGKYTVEKVNKAGRTKISWKPLISRSFDQIEFEFTEKNRLYLVRFYLIDSLRFRSRKVKDDFLHHFNISPEDPGRYRIKGKDIVLYIPNEHSPHLFEFTDAHLARKWFEVFNRDVSAKDRTGGSILKQILKKKKESSSKTVPQESRDDKIEWEKAKDQGSKVEKNTMDQGQSQEKQSQEEQSQEEQSQEDQSQ